MTMPLINQAYASIQKVASWHGMNTHWTIECIAEFWRLEGDAHEELFIAAIRNGINPEVIEAIRKGK